MTQLTLNIENKSLVPIIKKLVSELNGVSIAKSKKDKKSNFEIAMEDIEKGNLSGPFQTVEEVIDHLNK